MSLDTVKAGIDADLTTKPISKPELVTALKDMATSIEGDINNAPAIFNGTGDPGLTRAQAMVTTFTTPPAAMRTTGRATIGDYGGGLYVKVNAQPDHEGWFRTADLSYYELVHENGEVWVEQFGGLPCQRLPVANSSDWDRTDIDAAPGFNACVDYIVFNPYGKCDMRIGPGVFYLGSTVQVKGADFSIQGVATGAYGNGEGTHIRNHKDFEAFITHHPSVSFEKTGRNWVASTHFDVGQKVYFQNRPDSYVCTVAGTTSAASPPTGTGTGIIDGGVTWNYYRPTTRVERSNAYGQATFKNLFIWGHWNALSDPFGKTFGILCRARAIVRDTFVLAQSHSGVSMSANGDGDIIGGSVGNCNGWHVEDCSFYYNGRAGLRAIGADANAGSASNIDCGYNGDIAIAEFSFLGNSYDSLQSAGDGDRSLVLSDSYKSVLYAGKAYLARAPKVGVVNSYNYHDTPGTSDAWYYLFGDGTLASGSLGASYPDWSNTGSYTFGGAYISINVNARNLWKALYVEGGQGYSQFCNQDTVIGGLNQNFILQQRGKVMKDNTWHEGLTVVNSLPVQAEGRGRLWYTAFGGNGLFGGPGARNVFAIGDDSGYQGSSLEGSYPTTAGRELWWIQNGNAETNSVIIPMNGSTETFGRTNPVGHGPWGFRSLYVGGPGGSATSGAGFRRISFEGIIPADGRESVQGDKVFTTGATAGGIEGWVCTTSGLAGSTAVWKAFGSIAA
jgi:hypothetical protein